jgi:hypothetical protein
MRGAAAAALVRALLGAAVWLILIALVAIVISLLG